MVARETVEVTGHLMDSGILSRVLDDIREYGGDFVIQEFDVGHEAHDPSSARITVEAPDEESLQRLLSLIHLRDNCAGMLAQEPSGLGQADAISAALEEHVTGQPFEFGDVIAQRWLGQIE